MKAKLILAGPLQGVTDAAWRNAHAAVFGGVDGYYAPFMRVEHGEIRRRDLVDVSPERNTAPVVPQLLASPPDEAVLMASTLREMGYSTIDINLGCPHPPVANKRKGSGMLPHPHLIEAMATALASVEGVRYTVKMRLGWQTPDEWRDALTALAPIEPVHVTVHPRLGVQQYKGELLTDEFESLLACATYPIVFNGGIANLSDVEAICDRYPTLAGVMVGRGLIELPSMLASDKCDTAHYARFHQALLEGELLRLTGGEHQVLTHMKSLWVMLLPEADKRLRKRVLKAHDMAQYEAAVNELFAQNFR